MEFNYYWSRCQDFLFGCILFYFLLSVYFILFYYLAQWPIHSYFYIWSR